MTQTTAADADDRDDTELLWLVLAQLCGALKLPLERANDLADLRLLLDRIGATTDALGAREDALREEREPDAGASDASTPDASTPDAGGPDGGAPDEHARAAGDSELRKRLSEDPEAIELFERLKLELGEAAPIGARLAHAVLKALKRTRIRVAIVGIDARKLASTIEATEDMLTSRRFRSTSLADLGEIKEWTTWIAGSAEDILIPPARARFGEAWRIASVLRSLPASTVARVKESSGLPGWLPVRSRLLLVPAIWFMLRGVRKNGGLQASVTAARS